MDALEAIAERQGILRFRPDPVEPDKIEELLRAAAAAPSPVNLQPWAFVVITAPELTARIARYLVEVQETCVFRDLLDLPASYTERLMGLYEGFDRTPCFVLLCLQPKAAFARPEDEAVLRQWYLVSLGAAMENLMIAAAALGLGTRWFGGFALDRPDGATDTGGAALKQMLGIPDDVELIAATPLGYHDEPPKSRPVQDRGILAAFKRGDSRALGRLLRGRLALEEVVHRERW